MRHADSGKRSRARAAGKGGAPRVRGSTSDRAAFAAHRHEAIRLRCRNGLCAALRNVGAEVVPEQRATLGVSGLQGPVPGTRSPPSR